MYVYIYIYIYLYIDGSRSTTTTHYMFETRCELMVESQWGVFVVLLPWCRWCQL